MEKGKTMRKAIRTAALTLALTCPVYAGQMVNWPPTPAGVMPNLTPAGEMPNWPPTEESQAPTAGILLSLMDALGIF